MESLVAIYISTCRNWTFIAFGYSYIQVFVSFKLMCSPSVVTEIQITSKETRPSHIPN